MNKPYLLLLIFAAWINPLQAQSVREKILFDNDWKFSFGHAGDPSKDYNFSIAPIFSKNGKTETTAIDKKFDDTKWRSLHLPHDWAVELPFVESDNFDVMAHGYKPVGGLFPETSIGWYRKTFELTPADSGKRLTLQFDGVFRNSMVWINGFYLGNNASGYIGATFDITDYVTFKEKNIVVVRVDATQYEGWFYEGAGIYRHVWLNKFDHLHVEDDTFIYSVINTHEAAIHVEVPLANTYYENKDTEVLINIKDRNGKKVAGSESTKVSVQEYGRNSVSIILPVAKPRLWSIEDPYLYRAEIILKSKGEVKDQRTIRFGIREVIISPDKGLLLNGVPVKIKGVNCHQDHAGVGSAFPDYLHYYRIRLLKEMGANAYRTSHHAPAPELLEACDSLGMLVMDETRLLSSSAEYMDQFKRILLRDRNHPSIFMWSIGNEEAYIQKGSVGKRVALTMLQLQQKIDHTRTSTYAADLPNIFPGVNEVIPVRGFNYREKFVVPYHQDHPDQPVIGTEMGSTVTTRGQYVIDSLQGYLPDQDITAPWWASTAEAWWPTAATNDWYMGGFIWTGFDYRGEPTPFKWPNISSHFGVMDVCGFPKNLYYYYQSWWSEKNVIHLSPHWNWPGDEGKIKEVWVNSNADEVELFLNGKSIGRKPMARNSHLKWSVPYKKGKLEAIGYAKGKQFKTSAETTEGPVKIVLKPDKQILLADGRDIAIVNVTVVDKKGREVPDADLEINFQLTGEGIIMGGGNGDPSDHTVDTANSLSYIRKSFNGKCQIIIQASTKAGNIELQAQTPGMSATVLQIMSK